ncbi:MAG: hypothetical protein K6B38_02710 [Ruminococcus sp.]|nr:hypothetical protein [Ruminococcus sp.]
MKKATFLICIIAALTAISGCSDSSDKNSASSDIAQTSEVQTTDTPPAAEETTAPPKKTEISDFYGKWEAVRIIEKEDVYDLYYKEVPIDKIFQLEISEGGTASMGSGFPDDPPKEYSWEFKGRSIKLKGENEIYGSIKADHLILTNGEGLKIYMEKTDEFTSFEQAAYDAMTELNGGDISIPVLDVEADGTAPEDYVGKWECSYYEIDGEVFNDEIYGIPLEALFQIEIMKDNTAVFRAGGTDSEAVVTEYTWEADESGCIELYDDGELVSVAQLENGELYVDEGADITHYRSVDSFTDFDWDSLSIN